MPHSLLSCSSSMNKDASFKLLDAFYEAGGNFIDSKANLGSESFLRNNPDEGIFGTNHDD